MNTVSITSNLHLIAYDKGVESAIFDAEDMERGLKKCLMLGSPKEADLAGKLLAEVRLFLKERGNARKRNK